VNVWPLWRSLSGKVEQLVPHASNAVYVTHISDAGADNIFAPTNNKARLFTHNSIPDNIDTFQVLQVHPKEREIRFFFLHNVLLTNSKLFDMKLASSPNCQMCLTPQDAEHIFFNCLNALEAKNALNEFNSELSNSIYLRTYVQSLINRLLFLNKDKLIKTDLFCIAISNRIKDFDKINQNQQNKKELENINKLTLL